jgi:hypothetical protein
MSAGANLLLGALLIGAISADAVCIAWVIYRTPRQRLPDQ